ncbi:MAG: hypothetical protein JKY27_13660 [Magnetovibrio sp.]|nr:hypothetical protein [Magnetovibrio sp.]
MDYEAAAWGTQRSLAASTPKATQASQPNVKSRSFLDDVGLVGRAGLQKAGGPVLDLGISIVETLGSPLNLGVDWTAVNNARNYLDDLVSTKEKTSMAADIGAFLGNATTVGIDIGTFGTTAVGSAAGKSWNKGHQQNWSKEKQNKDLGYELGMGFITGRLGNAVGLLGKGTNLLGKNEIISGLSEKALSTLSAASAKYGIDLLAEKQGKDRSGESRKD